MFHVWHADEWRHQFNLHNKYTFVLKKDQWLAGGMATAHHTAIQETWVWGGKGNVASRKLKIITAVNV